MVLNHWRSWFHSSRVKEPLVPWVKMSASWLRVSTYLTWIIGSRFILSNNQSGATLWVRDTYLIVGLRPSMITMITASLSSNMYNKASWRESLAFGDVLLEGRTAIDDTHGLATTVKDPRPCHEQAVLLAQSNIRRRSWSWSTWRRRLTSGRSKASS